MVIYYKDFDNLPFAEFSLMDDSVKLDSNEFILKNFSESSALIENLLNYEIFMPADMFVLILSESEDISTFCSLGCKYFRRIAIISGFSIGFVK